MKLLLKLAVWKMRELEYEEDAFLLKLCLHIFREHKYNEGILEYLSGYYYGSVTVMEKVWEKKPMPSSLDVFDLAERILGQMLFTGQVREEAYGIFEDYRSLGGDGLVARAYLTWISWQDFVRDEEGAGRTLRVPGAGHCLGSRAGSRMRTVLFALFIRKTEAE